MEQIKPLALLAALALTGCASHPGLRTALIATAVISLAASHPSDPPPDGRVRLSPNPCVPDPARCK